MTRNVNDIAEILRTDINELRKKYLQENKLAKEHIKYLIQLSNNAFYNLQDHIKSKLEKLESDK